jgi:hypothetical protein
MGICVYCREKTGWLRGDAHDACAASSHEGSELISAQVGAAMAAGKTFAEVKATVEQIKSDHRLLGSELHHAIIEGANRAALDIAPKEPLSDERSTVLRTFFHDGAGLTLEEAIKCDGYRVTSQSNILWHIFHGCPYPYEPSMSFNLQRGETPLIGVGNVICAKEITRSSSAGGYNGLSLRVGHGIYYHLGGFKSARVSMPSLEPIDDDGFLLITTNNVYYGGQRTSFRVPYSSLVRIAPYLDGIGLFTNHGQAHVFVTKNGDYGWFLYNLLRHLSTNSPAPPLRPVG